MNLVDTYLATLKEGQISIDDYLQNPSLAKNRILFLTPDDTYKLHLSGIMIRPSHVKLHPLCTSKSFRVINPNDLIHLDASWSRIEYVPPVFKCIVYLDISHTNVTFVKRTPSIHYLRMGYSKVMKYQKTSNVRHLDVSHTPLASLSKIKRLRELIIDGTEIPYLPNYRRLECLSAKDTEYLDLTENDWKLKYVDLSNSLSELLSYKFEAGEQ